MTPDDPIISGPGEGERLEARHRVLRIKVLHPQLHLLEFEVGPEHAGPRPHYHERHVDLFYVLEGELEFRVGGATVRAGPGSSVLVPAGVVHAFKNLGLGRARFLNVQAPGSGFPDYMRARGTGEDVDPREFDVYYVDQ
jgi:mannose-6-phosphate isomerase-like protein (cupin superfamily)